MSDFKGENAWFNYYYMRSVMYVYYWDIAWMSLDYGWGGEKVKTMLCDSLLIVPTSAYFRMLLPTRQPRYHSINTTFWVMVMLFIPISLYLKLEFPWRGYVSGLVVTSPRPKEKSAWLGVYSAQSGWVRAMLVLIRLGKWSRLEVAVYLLRESSCLHEWVNIILL